MTTRKRAAAATLLIEAIGALRGAVEATGAALEAVREADAADPYTNRGTEAEALEALTAASGELARLKTCADAAALVGGRSDGFAGMVRARLADVAALAAHAQALAPDGPPIEPGAPPADRAAAFFRLPSGGTS